MFDEKLNICIIPNVHKAAATANAIIPSIIYVLLFFINAHLKLKFNITIDSTSDLNFCQESVLCANYLKQCSIDRYA